MEPLRSVSGTEAGADVATDVSGAVDVEVDVEAVVEVDVEAVVDGTAELVGKGPDVVVQAAGPLPAVTVVAERFPRARPR